MLRFELIRTQTQRFPFHLTGGVIAPSDFSSPNVDLNGNGVPDCLDSSVGYTSSLNLFNGLLGLGGFGIAGGCWNIDQGGGS